MADDDKFGQGEADADATRIIPRPGGKTRGRAAAPANPTAPAPATPEPPPPQPQFQPPTQPQPQFHPEPAPLQPPPPAPVAQPSPQARLGAGGAQLHNRFAGASKHNPLLDVAAPLLLLLPRLSTAVTHPDANGLRDQLVSEMKAFSARAQSRGIEQNPVLMAQYVLCTALDEAVLNTPWGGNSNWQTHNLLTVFHGERWGGEKCFQLLDRLKQEATKNLNLLELIYACLSLGFEGKFRVQADGRRHLESVREQLFQTIRLNRPAPERELSPQWRGTVDRQNALMRFVPLWVVAALGLTLLIGLYWTFSYFLNQKSDPLLHDIHAIEAPAEPARATPAVVQQIAPARTLPTLQELLAPEIGQRLLEVIDDGTNVIVRLRGDGLFASGRDTVKPKYVPVLERVAAALNEVRGPVVVTGHSDNVPIRTIRFPSNQHLSDARAEAVRKVLAPRMQDPQRLSAKGRADLNPVADNATREGRSLNRRVDLLVPRA